MLTVGIIFHFKANPDFVPYTDMEHYISVPVIAEVLTVHFEKRTMRVRWVDPDDNQKHTWDTSAEPFFVKYSIIPNDYETTLKKIAESVKSSPGVWVGENDSLNSLGFDTEPNPKCACESCNPRAWWMILCPSCGNKRCPQATHHDHLCTNSNEPGQKGSSFENCKPLGPATA